MDVPASFKGAPAARQRRALTAKNYAAAQVYALLVVAEQLETETSSVHLTNYEDLARAIAIAIEPDLERIANANR